MPEPTPHDKPASVSDAARLRRMMRQELAPFVADLALWHSQAARLFVEIDRMAARGAPTAAPELAARELLAKVRGASDAFTAHAGTLAPSSRLDDIGRAFNRLRHDLERATRKA